MTFYTIKYKAKEMRVFEIFTCEAESFAHAEEQCYSAYPECFIEWIEIVNKGGRKGEEE